MNSGKEEDFISFARQTLEQDLQGMDAATRSRLTRARAAAIASESYRRWMRIVPVASVALAATAALLIFLWPVAQGPDTQQLALEDMDVLGSEVDLDVLADPDFYSWLGHNNDAG